MFDLDQAHLFNVPHAASDKEKLIAATLCRFLLLKFEQPHQRKKLLTSSSERYISPFSRNLFSGLDYPLASYIQSSRPFQLAVVRSSIAFDNKER